MRSINAQNWAVEECKKELHCTLAAGVQSNGPISGVPPSCRSNSNQRNSMFHWLFASRLTF